MFYQVFRRVRRVFSFLRVEDREEVKIEKGGHLESWTLCPDFLKSERMDRMDLHVDFTP